MPYVAESSDEQSSETSYFEEQLAQGEFYRHHGDMPLKRKHRSQFGWRSRGEKEAAYRHLDSFQNRSNWADTLSIIESLDRIERAMTSPVVRGPAAPVHHRDYLVTEQATQFVTVPLYFSGISGPARIYTPRLDVVYPNDLGMPTNTRALAGQMMRRMRPTQPEANLGQWLGELDDFPRMFSRNSGPLSTKDIGSGHLNREFGWKPFLSDLRRVIDAVVESDRLINQLVENSAKLHQRRRTETLSTSTWTRSDILFGNNANYGWSPQSVTVGSGLDRIRYIFRKGYGANNARALVDSTLTRRTSLTSFALFEYFLNDPVGLLGRIRRNTQEAQFISGLNLTPEVVWDLLPFTWLTDWFVDVGSLLGYQQAVQDYSLAARRSGFTFRSEASITTRIKYFYGSTPNSNSFAITGGASGFSTYSAKAEWRRKGTPYDMGLNWDGFSPEQWAILGSLGLSGGPGVPLAG